MIPELNWLAAIFILAFLVMIFLGEDEKPEDIADKEMKKGERKCR